MKTYSVIYRTGGTENFKWHRVAENYRSIEQAIEKRISLEKAGYPSFIHDANLLTAIGLPETYCTTIPDATWDSMQRQ